VYGIPSIVSALGDYTTAEVTPVEWVDGQQFIVVDDRPATPGYKKKKLDQQKASIIIMLEYANIELENKTLMVKFGGPLLAASGVGASAASCVAFVRALNNEYKLGLNDNEINDLAYQGEKGYHGKQPSGVDNTAATFGGLIQFTKSTPPEFEHIKTPQPVEIVMGNTGLVTKTDEAVAGVRSRKEKEPDKYSKIFHNVEELVPLARKAFEAGDIKTVGKLMRKNHELLQSIEVSCPELDQLVKLSIENGAFGAKMTGSGLGGYMIALTPGSELQDRVADAIKGQGFEVLKTKIGV
jgi:mevalonate kinase